MLSQEALRAFWTGPVLESNVIVFFTIVGALALGLLVGYERFYHGRAAGMRTYGLVCMASAALTVIAGYPAEWFGGQTVLHPGADPTRIIQGIVTGIGFLGAGVIMKEGFNISGLTTAASIWAASVTGVLVGIGFYLAAILLALMSAFCMVSVPRLSARLPSRQAIAISLRFAPGHAPDEEAVRGRMLKNGYEMAPGTVVIAMREGGMEWQFVAVALNRDSGARISVLSREMAAFDGIDSFQISHARN
ncbi:MAG TPA: MgtC/SapB family protein [Noviherbaspirillum sp.]|uniref:MgtC/SapB family protein n=1 Tax=Noviherbaspirillum sp. TaxID=1926288 RepID=UPI002D68E531|nr:MgtC/SapB family protein [Noviherbaspirillum sp.]HYD94118.1 MgtC/SapB family protein [Noviherbaspirillum sp.]